MTLRTPKANASPKRAPLWRGAALRAFVAVSGALLLFACAAPRDPWGLAVSRGRVPEAILEAPDSLQANLSVAPAEPGSLPFSARLYARPRKNAARAYRLDAFGFSSTVLASYRWQEGSWLFVRHDEKTFLEGRGDGLEVEAAAFSLPDVHAVLGFVWGDLLPGYAEHSGPSPVAPLDDSARARPHGVRWTYAGESWEAVFDAKTGVCREVRSPSLRIRYDSFRLRDGRALPDQAEIFVQGKRAATLRLNESVRNPAWKKNPFLLRIPAGYSPLVREEAR